MNKTKEAVEVITKELVEDNSYWDSYQSIIAMKFYDEYYRYLKQTGKRYLNHKDIHKISNIGANAFLQLLCEKELRKR